MQKNRTERFPTTYAERPSGDAPLHRVRTITCSACEEVGELTDNARRSLPAAFVGRRFAEMGWRVGSRATKDKCPACNRPAKHREDETMTHPPKPASPLQRQPVAAEPPRAMERSDARRIRDGLDEHYLEEAGCYRESFTDDALAQKLKVPRAWVAQVREQFYGPEANQSEAKRQEDIRTLKAIGVELRAKIEAHVQAGMSLMDQVEAYAKRLDAL